MSGYAITDLQAVAIDAARTHASGPRVAWDVAAELLPAARTLFHDGAQHAPQLLEGLARLAGEGPFTAVPLHTAKNANGLPPMLRPGRWSGPAEDDVLRYAIAWATPADGSPWPTGTADPAVLAEAVRQLTGPIQCRTVTLRAVAVRYLMEYLDNADEAAARPVLRRIAWLMDPRSASAESLLLGLTAPGDPLIITTDVADHHEGATQRSAPLPLIQGRAQDAPQGVIEVAGRINAVRRHRNVGFADLSWNDQSLQLRLPPEQAAAIETGDLLSVRGTHGHSRSGHPVLHVDQVAYLQRGRKPNIPERVVDSALLGTVRDWLSAGEFTESISPILNDSYFGGRARPYSTWAENSGRRQYLRVTSELNLLEEISSGTTRCYEIGPSFRNEGLRGQSIKEFIMLEAYAADMTVWELTDDLAALVREIIGTPARLSHQSFDETFFEISGIKADDESALRKMAAQHIPMTASRTRDPDVLAQRLWRQQLRQQVSGLVAIHSIPGAASPMIAGEGRAAERVWLYADGVELAEISRNECRPAVLAKRFAEQFHSDNHAVHRDYRRAMAMFEAGVPPCVGLGLGLTRLSQAAKLGPNDTDKPLGSKNNDPWIRQA